MKNHCNAWNSKCSIGCIQWHQHHFNQFSRKSRHLLCVHRKSLRSCPTRCHPLDCSPPGSSDHGILQTRILEWVIMPSSRGFTGPRDQTHATYAFLHGQEVYHQCHWGTYFLYHYYTKSSSDGKRICLQCRRPRFNLCVWKIPWRRKWQPTPVFLPGESYGQRNLTGYSSWTATDTFTFLYTKSRLATMRPKQSHERLTFSPLTYLFCHHINLNSILSIISIKRTFSKMLEHLFLQNWFHNLEKIESNKKMNFIVIDSVGQTFFLILPDSSPKV